MGEHASHEAEVNAAINSMVVAAGALPHPLGLTVGAFGVLIKFIRDRTLGQQTAMTDTALQHSGLSEETFVRRLRDGVKLAMLFGQALEAAARAMDMAHARSLGRVVAEAVTDEASVDEAQLILATLRDLAPPHVRALALLASAQGQPPVPSRAPRNPQNPREPVVEWTSPAAKALRDRTDWDIGVAESVVSGLQRHGLIYNELPGEFKWGMTSYGIRVLNYLPSGPNGE